MLARIFGICTVFTLLISCGNKEMKTNAGLADWPYGITYEIFVQSFADSNSDGIGDIPGLIQKLDYLQDLGVQAVWLMPIHPSPSYHKYDVTDYYAIHPDYGNLNDFRQFVEQAHARNIKVIMDLVVNHTSWEHPWFQEAAKGPDNPYRDYYVWDDIDKIKDQINKKEVTLDSDNINQWHPWKNDSQYYYGFFYKGMPDLNFDNPKVRREIIAVGEYWLREFNVDGFRLDAAKHIFPDERFDDCHTWWQEFGAAMRTVNEDVYLVGEVWGNATVLAPYFRGLKSMFNFDFYHQLQDAIIAEKDNGLIDSLIADHVQYQLAQQEYIDALFVNNHDRNRLASLVNGNLAKSQLAFAIIATLPGMPFLYYGDEIGMHGLKPDEYLREPFVWDSAGRDSLQTRWIEPRYSTYSTVEPLARKQKQENSIFAYHKYWIAQRNRNEILRRGDLEKLSLNGSILGYKRSLQGKSLVVIHNLSGTNRDVNIQKLNTATILASFDKNVQLENGILHLPPYATAILR